MVKIRDSLQQDQELTLFLTDLGNAKKQIELFLAFFIKTVKTTIDEIFQAGGLFYTSGV